MKFHRVRITLSFLSAMAKEQKTRFSRTNKEKKKKERYKKDNNENRNEILTTSISTLSFDRKSTI